MEFIYILKKDYPCSIFCGTGSETNGSSWQSQINSTKFIPLVCISKCIFINIFDYFYLIFFSSLHYLMTTIHGLNKVFVSIKPAFNMLMMLGYKIIIFLFSFMYLYYWIINNSLGNQIIKKLCKSLFFIYLFIYLIFFFETNQIKFQLNIIEDED